MDLQHDRDAVEHPPDGAQHSGTERRMSDRRIDTCRRLLEQERIIDRTARPWVSANAEMAMLLELYAAEHDGRELYLWQLCNATTMPMATAHRKLGRLTDQGLTARTTVTVDRRRIGMRLTKAGIELIEALLDRLAR